MNGFKFKYFLFLFIFIFFNLKADKIDNESKNEKRINYGFNFSSRYCWSNIELSGRVSIYNKYIYSIVLYNYNTQIIFNKIFNHNINLRTGISLLNYGVKAGHIPKYVGQNPFTHIEIYDSIDVKTTSTCISFPIGINKCIKKKINYLEIEGGIINNLVLYDSHKVINDNSLRIKPWIFGRKAYFISLYFQFNYIIPIKKCAVEFSPIFNFTPNDISANEFKQYIKFYQAGLDIGLRF